MRTTTLLAGLLALALASSAQAQDWRTLSRGRQYTGEQALRVDLEYAAGRLQLQPAAPGTLYRVNLRYDADAFEPRIDYAGHELAISIGDGSVRRRNIRGGNLAVQLSDQAPLDLELAFGAAEADLDLSGLRVRSLSVETGASATVLRVSRPNPLACETADFDVGAARFEAVGLGNLNARKLDVSGGVGEVVLDFTGEWRGNMEVDVSMGLGSLTLRVPRGLGVQVHKEGLLAGFDSEGLIKRGNVYQSEGFEQALHRLIIRLDAALGSINMSWTQ